MNKRYAATALCIATIFGAAFLILQVKASPETSNSNDPKRLLWSGYLSMSWCGTRFILYDNNVVLFRNKTSPTMWYTTTLKPKERARLMSLAEKMNSLQSEYDLTDGKVTCQSSAHVFWVDSVGKSHSVKVTGCGMRGCTNNGAIQLTKVPPVEFRNLYDEISRFSAVAKPWLPDKIEVTLTPNESGNGEAKPWPEDLSFSQNKTYPDGSIGVLSQTKSHNKAAASLLASMYLKRNVIANGKQYSIDRVYAEHKLSHDALFEDEPDFKAEPNF